MTLAPGIKWFFQVIGLCSLIEFQLEVPPVLEKTKRATLVKPAIMVVRLNRRAIICLSILKYKEKRMDLIMFCDI